MHTVIRATTWSIAALVAGAAVCACGSDGITTDADRLARGREIVDRMSGKLASAGAFSVTTQEVRTEVGPSGQPREVRLTRETVVRRPDRLYSRVSGDRHNEVWYDGIGLTLVMHGDKVYAQARAPETLDRTLDVLHERYGVSMPLADYAYSSPSKALLSSSTTGGWVGRETVDGRSADHLSFKDRGVEWDVWIPASGDPLPIRMTAEFTGNDRLRRIALTFTGWNLAPPIDANRFTPIVPAGYEGIALLQRARVLRNIPKANERGVATTGRTPE
jgi:hypothetical protein